MLQKIIEFNKNHAKTLTGERKMPEFQSGDVVRVHRKIKEGDKERIQIFEGIIIAIRGKQSSSPMITVRKVSSGSGVELILPVFSPGIDKIELVKRAKVRRAKLYYLRGLTTKKSRMKYKDISAFVGEEEKKVEPVLELQAEEKKEEVESLSEEQGDTVQ